METFPDEVILKVLFFLPFKDIIKCSQVSKRFKAICNDESLWQKINLYNKKVPAKFVEYVIKRGCKYLNLSHIKMIGSIKNLNGISQLKYLSLSCRMASDARWVRINFRVCKLISN